MSEIIEIPAAEPAVAAEEETIQLSEAELYKVKYLNELANNRKMQHEAVVADLQASLNAIVSKYADDGKFDITKLDLDKGNVTRKAK